MKKHFYPYFIVFFIWLGCKKQENAQALLAPLLTSLSFERDEIQKIDQWLIAFQTTGADLGIPLSTKEEGNMVLRYHLCTTAGDFALEHTLRYFIFELVNNSGEQAQRGTILLPINHLDYPALDCGQLRLSVQIQDSRGVWSNEIFTEIIALPAIQLHK